MDFTNWINVPQPDIAISTQPSSLELIAGENKTIELQVKSTTGFKPEVHLYTETLPSGIRSNFTYPELTVPTYGQATTPMWISVMSGVHQQPYIITILTNSTIPTESIDQTSTRSKNPNFSIPPLEQKNIESITSLSSLMITVPPPLTIPQQIYNIIVAWQWLIAIGIGIIIDRFIPWDKVKQGLAKLK